MVFFNSPKVEKNIFKQKIIIYDIINFRKKVLKDSEMYCKRYSAKSYI